MATIKKHVKAVIQLRRATEQEWIDYNPILRMGEPALSTDKNRLKVGNGKDHWSDLPYLFEEEVSELIKTGSGLIRDPVTGALSVDYENALNLPSIENVVLKGNKTFSGLGINAISSDDLLEILQ